jgi:hypothetical protein
MMELQLAMTALLEATMRETSHRGADFSLVRLNRGRQRRSRRHLYDDFLVAVTRTRMRVDLLQALHAAHLDPRDLVSSFTGLGLVTGACQALVSDNAELLAALLRLDREGSAKVAESAKELVLALVALGASTEPPWWPGHRRQVARADRGRAIASYDGALDRFAQEARRDAARRRSDRKGATALPGAAKTST